MVKQRRDTELLKSVVEVLKEVRKERGLTQEVVYFDTDINMGRLEAGLNSITLTTLSHLCKYYGISLSEFFERVESKFPIESK